MAFHVPSIPHLLYISCTPPGLDSVEVYNYIVKAACISFREKNKRFRRVTKSRRDKLQSVTALETTKQIRNVTFTRKTKLKSLSRNEKIFRYTRAIVVRTLIVIFVCRRYLPLYFPYTTLVTYTVAIEFRFINTVIERRFETERLLRVRNIL